MSQPPTAGRSPGLFSSILLALSALSCTTAKRVEYTHDPTAAVHERYDLSRAELKPFALDAVLVAPFFRLFREDVTRLLLCLYASSPHQVTVRSAVLVGLGDRAGSNRTFAINQTVNITQQVAPGVLNYDVILADLNNDDLEAVAGSGGARLEVNLRVGEATADTLMRFDITRHETTQWVTH